MKKTVSLLIILILSIVCGFIFGDEVSLGYGMYGYVNSDGTLDWDTFYAEWEEIPDSYFIYLEYFIYDKENPSNNYLTKAINGGVFGILDSTRVNDIIFTRERPKSKLMITFSPFNFTNDYSWIRLGQKRYSYKDAIERWNFMLRNMQ